MTLPAGDARLFDVYGTGVHIIARHVQRMILDPATETKIDRESMRLPDSDKPRDLFRITLTLDNESREIAYIDPATHALAMHESYTFNKKGKIESERYWLNRRLVWSDFKAIKSPRGADWYTRKPDFKKLNCSR